MPARSLWIIFSVTSRWSEARLVSQPASDNPPALPRSLWQPAQYCDTNSACAAGVIAAVCDATGVEWLRFRGLLRAHSEPHEQAEDDRGREKAFHCAEV